MKIIICMAAIILVSVLASLGFVRNDSPTNQEAFDEYKTFISWNFERANLDNFAIYLRNHPETIGYIAFYVGKKDSAKKVRSRIEKSKRYLIEKRGIARKRLVVIFAGELTNYSTTVLQPLDKSLPRPYREVSNHARK
jgi:hypothetical protein